MKVSLAAFSSLHVVVHVSEGRDDALSGREKAFIIVHQVEGLGQVDYPLIDGFDHE